MLTCIAPRLIPDPSNNDYDNELNYTVIMDNANGPDITQPLLGLILKRDPTFLEIVQSDRMYELNDNTSTIRIRVCVYMFVYAVFIMDASCIDDYAYLQGENIDSVEDSEIDVTVGEKFEACTMEVFSSDVSIYHTWLLLTLACMTHLNT